MRTDCESISPALGSVWRPPASWTLRFERAPPGRLGFERWLQLLRAGNSLRAIARDPATISREMRRNRNPSTGKYRPFQAQRRASVHRARSKEGKIRPSLAPTTSPSSPPNSTAAPAGPSAGRPPQTSSQHWNDHCVAMIAGIRPSPPCAPAHCSASPVTCSGACPTSDSAPPTASTSSAAPPKSLTPQTDRLCGECFDDVLLTADAVGLVLGGSQMEWLLISARAADPGSRAMPVVTSWAETLSRPKSRRGGATPSAHSSAHVPTSTRCLRSLRDQGRLGVSALPWPWAWTGSAGEFCVGTGRRRR